MQNSELEIVIVLWSDNVLLAKIVIFKNILFLIYLLLMFQIYFYLVSSYFLINHKFPVTENFSLISV